MKVLLYIVLILLTYSTFADTDSEREATLEWLASVDKGQFIESWHQSAPLFKKQITSGNWEEALNQQRKPLGSVKNRRITDVKNLSSLPGLPDGNYAVLTAYTSFENKNLAVETIVISLVKNEWKVIGYFIK